VEVSGRYSNDADQEKRIRKILQCDVFGVYKTKTRNLRRPQRRVPPDELEALFERCERGAPVNVLAEEFSIHRSTVLDHLNRSTARRRYPALDEREVNIANQLYRLWTVAS
jgi:DNA invertase Pin-like site-specific DNA recombinase